MKRQNYILKIDKPCGQEWTSMTKNDIGKFCSHCSKTVIDFTQLTDNEILKIIELNSDKLCGRLTQAQLNRAIQLHQPTNNSLLYKTLAGILLVGASENLLAANNQKSQQEIVSIVNNNTIIQTTEIKSELAKDSSKNVVQGLVIDAKTKEPLSFASVLIKDTKTGTPTDLDGRFKLVIPDSLVTDRIYLIIAYVGYERTEVVINGKDLPITQNLVITPAEQVLMGEVIIVKKKKWWQRKKKSSH
jgi:hypothetical protein